MPPSKQVLVTGASELPQDAVAVAGRLGERLVMETKFVVVTGGVKQGRDGGASLDEVVARAAAQAASALRQNRDERILTVVPEEEGDEPMARHDIGRVVRLSGSTRRTRRYRMALVSDAVIGINGTRGSREVMELALMAEKPLILLPSTGGAALDLWKQHAPSLRERLRLTPIEERTLTHPASTDELVTTCLDILKRMLRPSCFIAMAFDRHPVAEAFEIIKKVLNDEGYDSVDFRKPSYTGNVLQELPTLIRDSAIVVADLSGHRPNVYYEVGLAHALGKPTVLFLREAEPAVHFDLMGYQYRSYRAAEDLADRVRETVRAMAPPQREPQ